jgi:hypothetical protein
VAQTLRRRAVAQDQLADRALERDALEGLRGGLERLPAQGGAAAWLGKEVAGPVGVIAARGDQQAAVRLFDIPDCDLDRPPARPPACLEPDDLAPTRKLLPELVRQRPLPCQDLPSVCTDGA